MLARQGERPCKKQCDVRPPTIPFGLRRQDPSKSELPNPKIVVYSDWIGQSRSVELQPGGIGRERFPQSRLFLPP